MCRGHSVEPTGPGVGSPGSRLYLLDDSKSALPDHDVTTTSDDVTSVEDGSSESLSGVWPISSVLGLSTEASRFGFVFRMCKGRGRGERSFIHMWVVIVLNIVSFRFRWVLFV